MGILQKEIRLIGTHGETRRVALFDSGASYSIIRRDIAESIGEVGELPVPEEWVFETAVPGQLVHATHAARLSFRFDDSEARFYDDFVVFDDCSEEVVIGAKTMQAWKIKLDFEYEEVVYRKTAERLRVLLTAILV